MKKKTFIFLGIFILLSFFLFILLSKPNIERSTIVTNEGVITFQSQEVRWIDRVLSSLTPQKQAVFSQKNTYIGESVTLSDYVPYKYNDKYIVDKVIFSIYRGENRIGTYETTFNKETKNYQRITATYIPVIPGEITARTELITCDEFGQNCLQYVRYLGGYGENSLIVENRPDSLSCNKESYWGGWEKIKEVPNGFIQEREFKEVTTECLYETKNVEKMLVCEDNYSVRSTNNSISIYTGSEICIPSELNIVIGKECEIDLMQNCSGKEIPIKACINGFYEDTGLVCEEIKESSSLEFNKRYILIGGLGLGVLILLFFIIREVRRK